MAKAYWVAVYHSVSNPEALAAYAKLAAPAIGIDAEQNPADRAHEKADAEGRGGEQKRGVLAIAGKE